MKKYFYSLLAATGLLLATSCSQDDLVNETGSESKVVTFKVNLPDQATSRAVGEGANATALIFAMYEEGSDEVVIAKDTYESDTDNDQTISRKNDGSFEVKVPMAKDIKYDLLFLAYNPGNCAFNIASDPEDTDLKALSFKNKLTANLDAYDAFVGVKKSQGITASGTNSVTLTRPFAQVNAATSDKDDAALLKSTVTTSEFRIYGVPSTYNVFEKEATGTMDVVFEKSAIPANETITKDDKTYNYLTLAYVLAGGVEQASTHKAEFLFYREDGKQVSSLYFENFPIQRNYRTNVLGNLLTQVEDYTVTIHKGFEGTHSANPNEANRVYTVTDPEGWAEVAAILESSGEDTISVKLGAGMGRAANVIEANEKTVINKDKTVFLDLNGYTLSFKSATAGDAMFTNNGILTITDSSNDAVGKITYKYTGEADASYGKGNYTIYNSGKLTLENGIIENTTATMSHASYAINTGVGATLEINGGQVLNLNAHAIRQVSFGTTANNVIINGGYIEGTRAFQVHLPGSASSADAPEMNLTINGGELKSNEQVYNLAIYVLSNGQSAENVTLTINNGAFNGNVALNGSATNTMKDKATSILGGTFKGQYGVFSYADKGGASKIHITGGEFSSLYPMQYMDNEEEVLTLGEDIEVNEIYTFYGIGTLNLNGHNITGTDTTEQNFSLIDNRGKLSIIGEGIISLIATVNSGWNRYSAALANNPGGNLTVGEGVTVQHLGGTDMAYGIDNLTNGKGTSAIVTIDGATVKSTYRAIRQFLNGVEATNELYVNSGVIEGSNKSIWMQDPNKNANTGKLVVIENVELRGDVYLSVTEGSTEWPVEVSIAKAALRGESKVLANEYVPEGYGVIFEDDVWKVVKEGTNYVLINDVDELTNVSIEAGKKLFLLSDIDLTGKEFNGLNAFNPGNNNTFDGQNHTISNWTYEGGASDMGFICNWVGPVRNINFNNCHLKTSGRSAIVAAKIYGNIDNVHVSESSIEDSYWACGAIAGLYNAGSITNCTVTETTVKSNGGTGGIVGVINEEGGERAVINCSVLNSTIHNTGVYGSSYSGGGLIGMFNADDNATYKIEDCTVNGNTLQGQHIFETYPTVASASIVAEPSAE